MSVRNPIEALGARLGVDAKQLLADIRANYAGLGACAGHRFEMPAEIAGPSLLHLKVRCTVCGGTMNLPDAQHYNAGLLAGRADPTLVDNVAVFDAALDAAWKRRKS